VFQQPAQECRRRHNDALEGSASPLITGNLLKIARVRRNLDRYGAGRRRHPKKLFKPGHSIGRSVEKRVENRLDAR
jgi:hypothetical protein